MNTAYDLSGHQKGIDIARLVRERQPPWLAFKLSEAQSFIDRESIKLLDMALTLNVPCSGYHFAWANRSASVQARLFADQDALSATTANPVLDIEGVYDAKTNKIVDVPEVGPKKALATYRALVEEVEQITGKPAVVYTSPGFVASFFKDLAETDDAQFLAARALWVAHYGVSAPSVPLFWKIAGKKPSVWQYDGGLVTRSPDGYKLDANRVFSPEDLVYEKPLVATKPLEVQDPRGPAITVYDVLDLVSRPGGQA